jgi:hypothetical protein
VFFPGSDKPVEPYYVNPWVDERFEPELSGMMRVLRGDSFCLPFGDNSSVAKDFPFHGRTSSFRWSVLDDGEATVSGEIRGAFVMEDPVGDGGRIVKTIRLRDDEANVYVEHVVDGVEGVFPYAQHVILAGGATKLISTSPIVAGKVGASSAKPFVDGEYHALLADAEFASIRNVPTRWVDVPTTDCSVFPARPGFVDIVQMAYRPDPSVVWTCAVCPDEGYVWFSMKRAMDFPSVMFWMENFGRHGIPWNGRNSCIGLEDVCSYFDLGPEVARTGNFFSEKGIPTCRVFRRGDTVRIPHIQGVVRVPAGFGRVARCLPDPDAGSATFFDESGNRVACSVDLRWLQR